MFGYVMIYHDGICGYEIWGCFEKGISAWLLAMEMYLVFGKVWGLRLW